jgi:hypothetical protein
VLQAGRGGGPQAVEPKPFISGATETFRAAMRDAGLDYGGELIADGKLHRFKAAGDRERNSWFVLFPASSNTPAAAAFGCWKRGFKETWSATRRECLTDAQWRSIREGWKLADDECERTEAERHAKARKIAAWILERAKPLTAHAYLGTKAVKSFGDVCRRHPALCSQCYFSPLARRGVWLHDFTKRNQSYINADLYLSISRRITPKIHSTTRKMTLDQCNIGTPKKKSNHKAMQIIGIFGPSVNHSLMAATQNRPKAINPNGIISVRLAIVMGDPFILETQALTISFAGPPWWRLAGRRVADAIPPWWPCPSGR